MAVLGLHFCARAFSSCGKRGPLLIAVRGPLTIAASLVAEHRLQMRRLSSCGSRAQLLRGMWDLPRPGLEPVSPALAGRLSTTAPPGKPEIKSSMIFYLLSPCTCLWPHGWLGSRNAARAPRQSLNTQYPLRAKCCFRCCGCHRDQTGEITQWSPPSQSSRSHLSWRCDGRKTIYPPFRASQVLQSTQVTARGRASSGRLWCKHIVHQSPGVIISIWEPFPYKHTWGHAARPAHKSLFNSQHD